MFTLKFFQNSIIDATQNKVMRRIIGWIILTVPAVVILFGLIGKETNPANWWNSISATYYTNSNALMVSLIAICAFFFCTYPGYSLGDRIVNRISGLGLFAILIFPCGDYNLPCPEKVGVFLLKKEISTIRTGRASPAMLDLVKVEYYGFLTPLKELAQITVPEPRQLLIKAFDPSSLQAIAKAIAVVLLGL